jgi:hypothetical protein
MVISIDDMKKCQSGDDAAGKSSTPSAPASAPAPGAADGSTKK